MKKMISTLLFASLFVPSIAMAQGEPKTQFIEIDAMEIQAERRQWNDNFRLNKPATFERLVRLKKSFLPRVKNTAASNVLN